MSTNGVMLLQVDAGAVRPLEKLGYTREEVEAVYGGSQSLVRELRAIGALVPCAEKKRPLLFDTAHVAQVWAEFITGKYDGQLESWRSCLEGPVGR